MRHLWAGGCGRLEVSQIFTRQFMMTMYEDHIFLTGLRGRQRVEIRLRHHRLRCLGHQVGRHPVGQRQSCQHAASNEASGPTLKDEDTKK